MSKIDIDKFVASLYKRLLSQMGFVRMPDTDYSREFLKALDGALKDNGLKFGCDEIIEIEPEQTIYFNDQFKVIDWDKAID